MALRTVFARARARATQLPRTTLFTPKFQATRLFCTPSASLNAQATPDPTPSTDDGTTHFGFEDGVSESEKTERVTGVFHKVAESYDRMNDLMSFGWHRVWKDHFVNSLNPGFSAVDLTAPAPTTGTQRILDVAGGTGDIAFRLLRHAHDVNGNPDVHVTIADINPSMLSVGRQRSLSLPAAHQASLSFLAADATALPPNLIPDASIDLYTVAFGIRNFGNIPRALREAYRVLRPGGLFACLEFSKVDGSGPGSSAGVAAPLLDAVYKRWSFSAIPLLGQLVAGDRDSYQYLVESIERFPDQRRFRDMITRAGFVVASGEAGGYENLTGGIAAIHKGMKPLDD